MCIALIEILVRRLSLNSMLLIKLWFIASFENHNVFRVLRYYITLTTLYFFLLIIDVILFYFFILTCNCVVLGILNCHARWWRCLHYAIIKVGTLKLNSWVSYRALSTNCLTFVIDRRNIMCWCSNLKLLISVFLGWGLIASSLHWQHASGSAIEFHVLLLFEWLLLGWHFTAA